MIRRGTINDLDSIYHIVRSVGTGLKNPTQGFLMNDYTKDEEKYKAKYGEDINSSNYTYVYLEDGIIKAFLFAYSKDQWLKEVPTWLEDIHWHPNFNKQALENYILINQTAMYPQLTGKGIGSMLYQNLTEELHKEGIRDIFAETVIAPVPNMASLHFRIKQEYHLAGLRYEENIGTIYSTLIYHKTI